MKTNSKQRSVRIISEIHPQHHGSMSEIKRMVLQSKIGGADAVKVQLYSSKNIWGDESRDYISITKPELKEIEPCEQWAGLRPGIKNNIPLIKIDSFHKNIYINSGHYRYGITMAPKSADEILKLIQV